MASIYTNLLEQKKAIYMRKELNSQRIVLVHQHGRSFTVLEHQFGRLDVMWKRSIEQTTSLGLYPSRKLEYEVYELFLGRNDRQESGNLNSNNLLCNESGRN